MLDGSLSHVFDSLRWPGWQAETRGLAADMGLALAIVAGFKIPESDRFMRIMRFEPTRACPRPRGS